MTLVYPRILVSHAGLNTQKLITNKLGQVNLSQCQVAVDVNANFLVNVKSKCDKKPTSSEVNVECQRKLKSRFSHVKSI